MARTCKEWGALGGYCEGGLELYVLGSLFDSVQGLMKRDALLCSGGDEGRS